MSCELAQLTRLGACALILCTATSSATLIVPGDLDAGDPYQLAFVTSGTTQATATDIVAYNSFVQSAANAADMGTVNWRAIASTLTVHAASNAVISAPVYNMNGELVATGHADFWDGTHASAIDFDENNAGRNFNVWTGTLAGGLSGGAGDALGEATPLWGESTFLSSGWTAHGGNVNTVSYSLYALSDVMMVPEPAALLPAAAALLSLFVQRSRRHPLPRTW